MGTMHKGKKGMRLLGLILSVLLLSSCSSPNQQEPSSQNEEVVIPVIFRVNPETNIGEYQDMVEEFNEKYEGIYRVEVEWLTNTASGYRERIKMLNALDQMPAIITDAAFDNKFYTLCVENQRFVDLEPYIQASPEWQECFSQADLEQYRAEDGGIYLAPLGDSIWSSAGIFYNKEILKEAGYTTFPETWEEFAVCLQKLEQQGIVPLALHGAGAYWSPMLISTAYMASDKEGKEFLETSFPESYQNESMRSMLNMMKELYNYTYSDALEIDYSEAQQRFFRGETAMLANGYWMIDEMSDELKQSIGFATFPENTMMTSTQMSSWAVISGYSEEVTAGAVEFVKYRGIIGHLDWENFLKEDSQIVVIEEYKDAMQSMTNAIPNYQLQWEQEIQNSFFTERMPLFLDGTLSADEFLVLMDEKLEELEKVN